jgi:hypothetical protein
MTKHCTLRQLGHLHDSLSPLKGRYSKDPQNYFVNAIESLLSGAILIMELCALIESLHPELHSSQTARLLSEMFLQSLQNIKGVRFSFVTSLTKSSEC